MKTRTLLAAAFAVAFLIGWHSTASAQWINVRAAPYNAAGDGVTDDTAAFQAAFNDSAAGKGEVLIPPANSGKCYLVGPQNWTHMTFVARGMGDVSNICMNGADAAGNWAELIGSNNSALKYVKLSGVSGVTPSVGLLWAWDGTAVPQHLTLDHVDIDASVAMAEFYAYAVSGLHIIDGQWKQRNEGGNPSDLSQRTTVIRLDGQNSGNVSGTFATVGTGANVGVLDTVITGTDFIDTPAGFGGGTVDNNAAFTCVTCGGTFQMYGGSIQCLCGADAILWWYPEGVNFNGTKFQASDGSITVNNWVIIGGGVAGAVKFDSVFFSVPKTTFVGLAGPYAGRGGGIAHLNIINPDVGGNTYDAPIVGTPLGCPTTLNPWIATSKIEGVFSNVVTCGDVDNDTLLQNISGVLIPPGSTKTGVIFNP